MSMLIGQTYNPVFKEEVKEGKEKVSFRFSLATRKAFIEEAGKSNLFTNCVTYQPGLARSLNKYFGEESHHGKSVVLYGHFDEYTWNPDPSNPNHEKYFTPFTITQDILSQGNIVLAQGSASEITILVPMQQTTRQFVVSGYEFADSANTTRTTAPKKAQPAIRVAGQQYQAPVQESGDPTPASDFERPL